MSAPDLRAVHWETIRGHLTGNRDRVHHTLGLMPLRSATAVELANALGWAITATAPRLTEIYHLGLAERTGERRDDRHVFRYISLQEAEMKRDTHQILMPV